MPGQLGLKLHLSLMCYCQHPYRTTPTHGQPTVEVVEYLRSLRFNWTKIATILGISRRTLYRRLQEWNLPLDINYSVISDSDLDRLVAEVKREIQRVERCFLRLISSFEA